MSVTSQNLTQIMSALDQNQSQITSVTSCDQIQRIKKGAWQTIRNETDCNSRMRRKYFDARDQITTDFRNV